MLKRLQPNAKPANAITRYLLASSKATALHKCNSSLIKASHDQITKLADLVNTNNAITNYST